jgi:RNase adapter protein RapZ
VSSAQTGPAEAEAELVIITGISGSGRTTVARIFEDLGFHVVDNVPQSIMPSAATLMCAPGRPVALVVDLRAWSSGADMVASASTIRANGISTRILFMDARDDVLVRRFADSRRAHPLRADNTLTTAIARERDLLAEAREAADFVIDTSELTAEQLAGTVQQFLSAGFGSHLKVMVTSFGFKHGAPCDADFMVDVRFLPNPYWVDDLRDQDGRAGAVSSYVLQQHAAQTFLTTMVDMISEVAPGFEREGRWYVTVGVGCTGGKHRSVAIAQDLGTRLCGAGFTVSVQHRDVDRE